MSKRKFLNNIVKSEKGIALVEVIAAIGIAVVVITSLVSLSLTTMRTSLKSKLLLEGSNHANRELELVRSFRDGSTWQAFIDAMKLCSSKCSMVNPTTVSTDYKYVNQGTAEQIIISFKATKVDGTTVVGNTDNIVRVAVTTTWTVGDTTQNANLYTDFSNWRGK